MVSYEPAEVFFMAKERVNDVVNKIPVVISTNRTKGVRSEDDAVNNEEKNRLASSGSLVVHDQVEAVAYFQGYLANPPFVSGSVRYAQIFYEVKLEP